MSLGESLPMDACNRSLGLIVSSRRKQQARLTRMPPPLQILGRCRCRWRWLSLGEV